MTLRDRLRRICTKRDKAVVGRHMGQRTVTAMQAAKQADAQQYETMLAEYAKTKDPALRKAIIEHYLYIPEIITKRYANRGVEYDDLYQAACVGLINAVDRFDISKGVKFSTFATPTVLGEVKKYFRDRGFLIKLPRKIYEVFQKAHRIRLSREQYDGYVPTLDELAQALNLPEQEISDSLAATAASNVRSLEQTLGSSEDIALSQVIGVEEDAFLVIENHEFLCASLRMLTREEKKLLVARFYKNQTQKEIAAQWNVSQMYISRLERKMLEKLKKLYLE